MASLRKSYAIDSEKSRTRFAPPILAQSGEYSTKSHKKGAFSCIYPIAAAGRNQSLKYLLNI
jgi:hypothetical protein